LKTNKDILMTLKEEAELLFKQESLFGGRSSIPEYEQRARTERAKTAKLRMLRLAHEAALATSSPPGNPHLTRYSHSRGSSSGASEVGRHVAECLEDQG
jgi:hypothetical protein